MGLEKTIPIPKIESAATIPPPIIPKPTSEWHLHTTRINSVSSSFLDTYNKPKSLQGALASIGESALVAKKSFVDLLNLCLPAQGGRADA